jgi:hypothetical protein
MVDERLAWILPRDLNSEIEACSEQALRAYIEGAKRDATFNRLHNTVRFSQADQRWLWVLKLILRNLGSNSWVYREGRRRVWVLETTYQNRVSSPLPSAIEEAEFVRGYFDAEGGVPRRLNDRFYIQLVQKNRLDLNRVRDSIRRQGIHAVDCTIPAPQLIRTTGVSMSE